MPDLNIAFIPIARTTFDIDFAREKTNLALVNLQSCAQFSINHPSDLVTGPAELDQAIDILSSDPDLLVIFQATFADSSMAVELADACDSPVLLWAVPEEHTGGRLRLNSLCGINLAGHALTRQKIAYSYLFTDPGDPEALSKVRSLAQAGLVRRTLQHARIGRVGENPEGFDTCLVNHEALQHTFGLEIVQYDLQNDIFPAVQKISKQAIQPVYEALAERVSGLETMEPAATYKTLGAYLRLTELSQQNQVGGFAVRCWPEFFTELGCAACGAMSMLSDEMTPCSCEADVNGTITQLILQTISGGPAFGTDVVSVDAERDAMVLWHCGLAPLSMADPEADAGVTVHSNRKLPLLMEFSLKPGRVTIARLSEGSGGFKLVIGGGEVIRAPKSFSGTSGLLKFDSPATNVLDVIMNEGLEHHVSLTYGDHRDALEAVAEMYDLPVVWLR